MNNQTKDKEGLTFETIIRKINAMNDALDPDINLPVFGRTGEPATIIDPGFVWDIATDVMNIMCQSSVELIGVKVKKPFPDEYYEDELGEEIRNYVLGLICELLGEDWRWKPDDFDENNVYFYFV